MRQCISPRCDHRSTHEFGETFIGLQPYCLSQAQNGLVSIANIGKHTAKCCQHLQVAGILARTLSYHGTTTSASSQFLLDGRCEVLVFG
jgi:hypothetical protein